MSFNDLVAAQEDSSGAKTRRMLRDIAESLGISDEFEDSTLDLVARELSKLRPLGDPIHPLRSAQVFAAMLDLDPVD